MNKLFALVVVLLLGSYAVGNSYTIRPLGLLDGSATIALALNDNTQVVGYSSVGPFIWEDGAITQIPHNGDMRPYVASAINNAGEVVGWGGFSERDDPVAFLYRNGSSQRLQNPWIEYSQYYATSISDSGLITGFYQQGQNGLGATRWEGYQTPNRLDGLVATDVNTNNQIVGRRYNGTTSRQLAFRWENGVFTDLHVPVGREEAYYSHAQAVNANGNVVGWFQASVTSQLSGFLWNGAAFVSISYGEWFSSTRLYDVNPDSVVIGESVGNGGVATPFLWSGGSATALNQLLPPNHGWVLETARGINARGQIVGTGVFGGSRQGYLMTPVPEPTTLTVLAGAALIFRRRKRQT